MVTTNRPPKMRQKKVGGPIGNPIGGWVAQQGNYNPSIVNVTTVYTQIGVFVVSSQIDALWRALRAD